MGTDLIRVARALFAAETGEQPPTKLNDWDARGGWRAKAEAVLREFGPVPEVEERVEEVLEHERRTMHGNATLVDYHEFDGGLLVVQYDTETEIEPGYVHKQRRYKLMTPEGSSAGGVSYASFEGESAPASTSTSAAAARGGAPAAP